ncbi:Sigma-70 region 2 [Brevibacterium iodinum ATCC 49514]|uniref:Sigma-70 region 2 n=1 Tax=Brevibacterium iodinum ATCC 49514 TaxID=1255616 RepID=A0A2H1JV63_9MICO|nr:sigma factor [Brevibacterium iodinum]SMX91425.1 Sigma-70 region 2 [Brevibacterium iodinum ATCC 49514]SUW70167.1 RNA polymerase sigma factor [Brevibacterium iodinum]
MQEHKKPFSEDELLAAVETVSKRTIRPRMASIGLSRWADDVAGEVIVSAWKARAGFDPELGRLEAWLTGIARNRMADLIDMETRRNPGDLVAGGKDSSAPVEEALDRIAAGDPRSWGTDIAVVVAEHLATMTWLRPVISAAASVMETQAFMVGFLTHLKFESDVRTASKAFGLSEQRVRDCKRLFELHCQVIRRAIDHKEQVSPRGIRVTDLIQCLPGADESGAWTRETAMAMSSWKGPISKVPVEHVVTVTGWERNTVRQYVATTRTLLQVALGVLSAEDAKGRE